MIEMKKQKKMLKASFTVEAAIIMPLIIIVIMLLIYLAFFLYNRCVISQIAYVSALRGSLSEKSGKEREQELQKEEKTLFEGRIIGSKETSWKNEIENNVTIVKADSRIKVPFAALTKEFKLKNIWTIAIEKKAEKTDAVKFIRGWRKIESNL